MTDGSGHTRLIWGGFLLGLGFGGFFGGIALRQLRQWHHMLSSDVPADTVAGLEVNTVADGFFHVAAVFTAAGLTLLWRAARRPHPPWSTRLFVGLLLMGWGAFNLGEGLIDHHFLGVHHANETAPRDQWLWWDLAFLARGAVTLLGGWALARAGAAETDALAATTPAPPVRPG